MEQDKLKTLENLDIGCSSDCALETHEMLRTCAIAWVKRYEKLNDDAGISNLNELAGNYLVKEWIKMFFNLIEEDLECNHKYLNPAFGLASHCCTVCGLLDDKVQK